MFTYALGGVDLDIMLGSSNPEAAIFLSLLYQFAMGTVLMSLLTGMGSSSFMCLLSGVLLGVHLYGKELPFCHLCTAVSRAQCSSTTCITCRLAANTSGWFQLTHGCPCAAAAAAAVGCRCHGTGSHQGMHQVLLGCNPACSLCCLHIHKALACAHGTPEWHSLCSQNTLTAWLGQKQYNPTLLLPLL
jgi:hypothetical protein